MAHTAKEEYDKIMADEHEKMLIRLRKKYWLDYNSMKSASYDEGMKVGKKERYQRTASKSGKREIAEKLKKRKYSIEEIMEITGLSKEEI